LPREKIVYLLILPSALFFALAGPLVLFGIGTESDFIQFYAAGQILRGHHAESIYDYSTERQVQLQFTNHAEPMVYNHPPFEAVLFLPLSYLSFRSAFVTWTFTCLLLFGAAMYALRGYIQQLHFYPLLIAFSFLFFPFLAALLQGQDSMLILFSYALAHQALKRRHELGAGLLFSIVAIKPQLLVPFLALSVLGLSRRFALGLTMGCVALAAISLAVVGKAATFGYLALLMGMNSVAGQRTFHITPSAMPNLRGIAYCALSTMLRPMTLNVLVVLLTVCLIVAFMKSCKFALIYNSDAFELSFALASLLTLIFSFHLLLHDMCLAILPVLILLKSLPAKCPIEAKYLLYGSLISFVVIVAVLVAGDFRHYCLLFVPLAGIAISNWLLGSSARVESARAATS
jgi:Glycosyltransferase family 87